MYKIYKIDKKDEYGKFTGLVYNNYMKAFEVKNKLKMQLKEKFVVRVEME